MVQTEKVGYSQVKDQLLERIQNKDWPAGHLLPTELELSRQFGCARATVSRALNELAEAGLIDRKRKAGSRVLDFPRKIARMPITGTRNEIAAMGAEYRHVQLERSFGAVPDWVWARTMMAKSVDVLYLRCLFFADNNPFALEDCWINATVLPNVADQDFTSKPPCEWLLPEEPLCEGRLSCFADISDQVHAKFLDVPIGRPVFTKDAIVYHSGTTLGFFRLRYRNGYSMNALF